MKHDFRDLPSVTKSSITDSLEKIKATLNNMRVIVEEKELSWLTGLRGGLVSQQVNTLRCFIVDLELSVDTEDESNGRRDDTSPSLKTLFRRCVGEYTTVSKRIDKGSLSLMYKLPSGHIEGPRNEFIRWGREAGVLREGRKSLETKIVESDKSESRDQIVKIILCIKSALGAMSEFLPEKHVSGEYLTTADTDNNSNSNLSLTELAKGLKEQIAILRQYNESLIRETKNLVRK